MIKFKDRVVSVVVGKTVNLGDFNSFKAQAGFTGTIPDNEDLEEAYAEAYEEAETALARELDGIGLK